MRPWKLITTTDPDQMLGDGEFRHFGSLLAAANAFAKDTTPYKTIVFDDGCVVRELTPVEERHLGDVCALHGFDVDRVGE